MVENMAFPSFPDDMQPAPLGVNAFAQQGPRSSRQGLLLKWRAGFSKLFGLPCAMPLAIAPRPIWATAAVHVVAETVALLGSLAADRDDLAVLDAGEGFGSCGPSQCTLPQSIDDYVPPRRQPGYIRFRGCEIGLDGRQFGAVICIWVVQHISCLPQMRD